MAGAIGRDPAAFQIDFVEAILARELLEIDQIHPVAPGNLVSVGVQRGLGALHQVLAHDPVRIDGGAGRPGHGNRLRRHGRDRNDRKAGRRGAGELNGRGGGRASRQQGRTAQDQATSGKPHATPLARFKQLYRLVSQSPVTTQPEPWRKPTSR
ncbi:hypothetical protein D3C85_1289280 [compost metagenome]